MKANHRMLAAAIAVFHLASTGALAAPGPHADAGKPRRDRMVTVVGEVKNFTRTSVFVKTATGLVELPAEMFGKIDLQPGMKLRIPMKRSELSKATRTPASAQSREQAKRRR